MKTANRNLTKRWRNAVDMLHATNSHKPTWQRDSEVRMNLGRVNAKSQQKKRKAKK